MKGTAMPYDHSAYNSGDSSSTPVMQHQPQQQQHALQQQQQQQQLAHMQHRQDQQHNAMQHGLHAATGTFFIPEPAPQGRQSMLQQGLGGADSLGMAATSMYNAQPPTAAEIDAILSAYGAPPNPSAAQGNASLGAADGRLDVASAASAAAAYGHLGYGALADGGDGTIAGPWNGQQASSSRSSAGAGYAGGLQVHGMPQRLMAQQRMGGSGGYEGDSSNNSSTQTPGGGTSSDDSGDAGRRRRMTFGGMTPENAPAMLPQPPNSARFAPLPDGSGAVMGMQRPNLQHQPTSTIDSMQLESMAEASLRRASEDNAPRPGDATAAGASTTSSTMHHRRSYSGGGGGASQRLVASRSHPGGALEEQRTASEAQSRGQYGDNGVDLPHDPNGQGYSHAALKRSSYGSTSGAATASSGGTNMLQGSSLPGLVGGHAASHPPGLGSQVMRGPDRPSLGLGAASDFTKRKGWSNRIVEELLDFVHVLDAEGRVLFASPSVYALTGWKAEELRGRQITEFIHPEDVDDVLREFNRTLVDHSDLLMYYRFRRKPQTAADKRQKRADIEEATAARSPSGSASESTMGDSSSNGNGVMGGHAGKNRPRDENSAGRDEDDTEDHYEVFEATGHPYFPPQLVAVPASGLIPEEDLPKILPEGFAIDGAASTTTGGTSLNKPMSRKSSADSTKDVRQQAADAANAQGEKLQCFFCSCRIYPTKNVSMLDSFLELKLENERLRVLLADLEVSDGPAKGAADASEATRKSLDEPGYHPDFYKAELEASFRRQSAGSAIGAAGPFGASQPTSPVMPSMPNPALALERTMTTGTLNEESDEDEGSVTGGAGGTEDGKRKKKKPKPDDGDYVCTDCGRVDSPEWRKGPLGPKTLCNACGLRWAKKVKRGGVGDPSTNIVPPGVSPFPPKKAPPSAARPSGPPGAQRMMQPPGAPTNLVGSPSFSGGSPIFMGEHQQRAMQQQQQRMAPQQHQRPSYPDARMQQQQQQQPRQPGDYLG